jgi:rubrerythrin
MATGETGFGDVIYDLVSVQYHALKAGHDYGQYVRDARNGGHDDLAQFFEQVMQQNSQIAAQCHEFLGKLQKSEDTPGS